MTEELKHKRIILKPINCVLCGVQPKMGGGTYDGINFAHSVECANCKHGTSMDNSLYMSIFVWNHLQEETLQNWAWSYADD